MSEKILNLITNGQYMIASLAFGIGSWLFKVRQNKLKPTAFSFFSEITFALLAGFITFWICQNFNLSENMMWIMISINSWSGSKFLSIMEYIVAKMTADKFNIDYTPIKTEEGSNTLNCAPILASNTPASTSVAPVQTRVHTHDLSIDDKGSKDE